MAADIARTPTDDAAEALAALDAADRELRNWRAHLERILVDPNSPGTAHQACRSSSIVAGVVADAVARTRDAARRVASTSGAGCLHLT